ncbi:hypothetical protein SLS61_002916 [Didymella pomorum]
MDSCGAAVDDVKSARYGAKKYAMGNKSREHLKQRIRPNRVLAHGYNTICSARPTTPRMASEEPSNEGEKDSPPVKWMALALGSWSARRGDERKIIHNPLKAPMWRSKMATLSSVHSTFGVQILEKGSRVGGLVWLIWLCFSDAVVASRPRRTQVMPRILATLKATGSSKNALECHFACTLSATMVLAAPTVPFTAPDSTLQVTISMKLRLNPTPTQPTPVPNSPTSSTIRRPTSGESAARPQSIDVTIWANVKDPWSTPA